MQKATAPQMRQCLEMVEVFKKAGMRFVPMPALDDEEFRTLCLAMDARLESLVVQIESAEAVRP